MAKNAMRKMTWREIRQSLGRYLAILSIIALGAGFLAGLRVSKPSMLQTADLYTKNTGFFDFRILSTLGLTEEDVTALESVDGIESAEGSIACDVLASIGDSDSAVYHLMSITQDVNQVVLRAGRMPETPDECVLDAYMTDEACIGQTITIAEDNESDTLDMLKYKEYTIVGLVNSPVYLNYERGTAAIGNGKISKFVYLLEDGFDVDYYTEINLCIDGNYYIYSQEYDDHIDTLTDPVTEIAESRGEIRYETLYAEAKEEIDDGWAEWRDGEQDFNDAKEKYESGKRDYEDGLATYNQNLKDYEDGYAEYLEGKKTYEENRAQFDDNYAEYLSQASAFEEAYQTYQQNVSALSLLLSENERQIAANQEELQKYQADFAQFQEESAKEEGDLTAEKEKIEEDYQSQSQALQRDLDTVEGSLATTPEGSPEYEELLAQQKELQLKIDELNKQHSAALKDWQSRWDLFNSQKEADEQSFKTQEQTLNQTAETLAQQKQDLKLQKLALDEYGKQLESNKASIEATGAFFAKTKEQLDDTKAQLDELANTFANAKVELEDGKKELQDAKRELDDGAIELADAEKELQDGRIELEDAEKKLQDLKPADVYVLTRGSNIGYVCFESDSSIVEGVSTIFPMFFFLVAALVCITTMTRMVDDQRTQIGVLKALGYSNRAIISKYLIYAGSASLIGCIIGIGIGSFVFPSVIWQAYDIMYGFAELTPAFDLGMATLITVAYLLCALGATYFSCRSELAEVPAELIRPKSPPAGKRIFLEHIPFVWRRLSFLQKVSMRNIFRYKKRLFMMVLGIGGCTALLIAGYGIRDSIADVTNYQYEQITLYNGSVTFNEDNISQQEQEEFVSRHTDILEDCRFVHESTVDIDLNGTVKSIYLVVAPQGLDGYIDLHRGSEPVSPPGESEVLLNDGLAERLKISVGDTVTLRDSSLKEMTLTVSGIFDNYIYNYAIVSPETAAKYPDFDTGIQTAYFYLTEEADLHEAAAALTDDDMVSSVNINDDMRERVSNMMGSLDAIVWLIIACAGALAFIVLYNLTNINITERVREIATIKVLGFRAMESAAYVFRENFVLTGIGAIIGVGLGIWLHAFVMGEIQVDLMSFDLRIAPLSFVIAIALTFVFSFIVDFVMYFKLERINMAEALKSIE